MAVNPLPIGRTCLATIVLSPTERRTVLPQGAGMETPTADGGKQSPFGRRRLTEGACSPTDRRAVLHEPTDMTAPTAYGCEPYIRRDSPMVEKPLDPPTRRRAVFLEDAAMVTPGADSGRLLSDLEYRRP